jgi:hypothetical protein
VSDDRIRLDPEATQEEAEAVRQALAALGLIEDGRDEDGTQEGAAGGDP